MNTKKILQPDLLDIIFNHRNKDYGAYELRRNYHQRARKAVSFMLLFALLVSSIPLVASLFTPPAVQYLPDEGDTVLIQTYIPPADPVPAEPVTPIEPSHGGSESSSSLIDIVEAATVADILPDDPFTVDDPTGDPVSTSGTNDHDPVGGSIDPGSPTGSGINVVDVLPDPETRYESFDIPEQPEFPGGEEALMEYLGKEIRYPKHAVNSNIEGKVTIGFVVNKLGEIEDIKILKALGYGCDEEAKRVIAAMPKWKPGRNNGRPVSVYFNLPIVFELRP